MNIGVPAEPLTTEQFEKLKASDIAHDYAHASAAHRIIDRCVATIAARDEEIARLNAVIDHAQDANAAYASSENAARARVAQLEAALRQQAKCEAVRPCGTCVDAARAALAKAAP